MFKTILVIVLTLIAVGALAQTSNAPLSLEVAQQRARYALEQIGVAADKVKAVDKKDKAAQKRLEEVKTEAENAAKQLQEAQAELTRARERHDQAYKDLKRAHDALQESNRPQ